MAGKGKLVDSFVTGLCVLSIVVLLIPLSHIIATTAINGLGVINIEFLTSLPLPPGETGGGIGNAILGTITLAILTMAISIPISLMIAIYLAEYPESRFRDLLRVLNDGFIGTPSIVAGVFAYTLVVLPFRFSALAGALALSVLAIPSIVRSSEEALKLVPFDIREAGLSLGLEQWKVILNITLRIATPAIASGILLSLARVMGETAPLVFTAFGNPHFSIDILQPVSALPLITYAYAISPYQDWHQKAWGSALILMLIVLAINLIVKYRLGRGK